MRQQQAKVKRLGLENVVDIEMKCLPAVVWMESSGIHVDFNKFKEIKTTIQNKYYASEAFLQKELVTYDKQVQLDGSLIPNELNLNSPEQLKHALKNRGYDIRKTDKKTRAKYVNDPIFEALTDFKEAETLLKMFIKPLPEFINSSTNRIYPEFWQYGATSGRFTCGKPNLQQQPSRFKNWRTIFTAEPGNKIVACDYSQIELRIIGELAKDPQYMEAYKMKQDLHIRTAAAM